ncbi:hypothetical protein VTI28DRAFT_6736 [Corynascus sepedonium]
MTDDAGHPQQHQVPKWPPVAPPILSRANPLSRTLPRSQGRHPWTAVRENKRAQRSSCIRSDPLAAPGAGGLDWVKRVIDNNTRSSSQLLDTGISEPALQSLDPVPAKPAVPVPLLTETPSCPYAHAADHSGPIIQAKFFLPFIRAPACGGGATPD